MAHPTAQSFAEAIQRLTAALAKDLRLRAELHRARRSWFGGDGVVGDAAAEARFREWVALERPSEVLGAVPAEVEPFAGLAERCEGSLASVFAVVGTGRGTALLRDEQDESVYEVLDPDAALRPGDLFAGRLFQDDAGWVPSTAAAVFRPGGPLAVAFRRDLERADLDRRLQQIEVEHLLLRRPEAAAAAQAPHGVAPAAVPLEHLEARLDLLLRTGGSELSAAALCQQLRAAPRLGPVLGPVLDTLAFDSAVDLEATRQILCEIWNAWHPEPSAAASSGEPPAGGLSLGAQLAQKLDAGLAAHRDVGELFAELEKLAGVDPEAEDELDDELEDDAAAEDGADGTGPDPGGDLDPMVQEYLWQAQSDPAQAVAADAGEVLAALVRLQHNGPLVRPDLDQVTAADADRLLLHVFLAALPERRAAAVASAHRTLQAFFDWARAELEDPSLGAGLREHAPSLLAGAERLAAAGLQLSTPEAPKARPQLFLVEDLGPGGFGARDDDGDHHWFACGRAAAGHLQRGDLVLGARSGAGANAALVGLVVVLPASARAHLE
ncbi:MAG: hypothetical protein JNK49_14585 [Planctomycetes bacterium]|nr:hypothetical protein [Planctomycetota bacterium]